MRNRKERRKGYSCIEKSYKYELNPIEHIKRWGRNIKYMHQRIHYGYCDTDVWSIDWWFLSVVPYMLERLRDTTHGYPGEAGGNPQALFDSEAPTDTANEDMLKWKAVLTKMAFLFKEAHEETCTKENPYEEEWENALKEFSQKYGPLGEGLRTEAEKEEEKKKGYYRMYGLDDVPEYKEIDRLHYEEERSINEYRNKCKEKAMELFNEWFWDLWD